MQETAFHYVGLAGNEEVLQCILDHTSLGLIQIVVNRQSNMGWAPLLAASSKGHATLVKSFLSCNARVDVFDNEGRSALHLAAECGSMEVCKDLLEKNAFVNSKSKIGLTALHYAAIKGKADLISFLVKDYGALVDSMNNKRQTPLHSAAQAGMIAACEKLIELEAGVDAYDDMDQRPIHLVGMIKDSKQI